MRIVVCWHEKRIQNFSPSLRTHTPMSKHTLRSFSRPTDQYQVSEAWLLTWQHSPPRVSRARARRSTDHRVNARKIDARNRKGHFPLAPNLIVSIHFVSTAHVLKTISPCNAIIFALARSKSGSTFGRFHIQIYVRWKSNKNPIYRSLNHRRVTREKPPKRQIHGAHLSQQYRRPTICFSFLLDELPRTREKTPSDKKKTRLWRQVTLLLIISGRYRKFCGHQDWGKFYDFFLWSHGDKNFRFADSPFLAIDSQLTW